MNNRDLVEVFATNNEPDTYIKECIKKAVVIVLDGEKKGLLSLSVVLSDDKLLRQLNSDSLGFDETTDVLSYDLSEEDEQKIEGEIYISLDRVNSQAEEHLVKPETELIQLVIHGVLHLCGMDHNDDVSLKEMTEHGEKYINRVF